MVGGRGTEEAGVSSVYTLQNLVQCWHLEHGHLPVACKSERECWLEPRAPGAQAQALSMNHIWKIDLGVALTLHSGISEQAWREYIWVLNRVLQTGVWWSTRVASIGWAFPGWNPGKAWAFAEGKWTEMDWCCPKKELCGRCLLNFVGDLTILFDIF